ncbi:Hsp33 family molecular chaperone HslO [Hyphomonas oceanitis]|uniref:Hsp33 family molecular chaperone HslO n=1 Tax=Hyphomonas oceanitis TaxID=81033 RepID=UPI0030037249
MTDIARPDSDFVVNFQIDQRPVRGRAVRMGADSLSPILQRHDYPRNLARILGEAVTLAAMVGASLKFEGRILVQAEGDGPVSMLVGEYRTDGGVRGYAKFDADRWAHLEKVNKGAAPHMPQLFGPTGRLALILIQDDPSIAPYQGIVPLEKGTLSECAEEYFAQSEQVPSRIKLAVAELDRKGEKPIWVSGGMMVQRIAGDENRGDTTEFWREAEALFGTLSDAELVDPDLAVPDLLFRLFHEQGVRMEDRVGLLDSCTCNEERLVDTLKGMPDNALREMVEPDGTLAIDCQFCARHYTIPIEKVTDPVS